jgi:hypothetical protein
MEPRMTDTHKGDDAALIELVEHYAPNTKLTLAQIEAACRAIHEAVSDSSADELVHAPYQKSWEPPEKPRWKLWVETVGNMEAAIDAASPTDDAALVKGEEPISNDQLDPFEEIGQALYEEGYRNGFADANFDGETYDLDRQLEGLDGELIRDGWYEGNKNDFLVKVEAALAARGADQGADLGKMIGGADEGEAVAWTDDQVEKAARAHDEEDSAQRGEPTPWLHYNCANSAEIAATCPDCAAFRSERLVAMRKALETLTPLFASPPLGGWKPDRKAIVDAIADADRRLNYSMNLVRLVDGDSTYTLEIDGQTLTFTDSETPEWNAQERLYAHVAECKIRLRADAILALPAAPLLGEA